MKLKSSVLVTREGGGQGVSSWGTCPSLPCLLLSLGEMSLPVGSLCHVLAPLTPCLDEEEGGTHLGVWLVGGQPQNGAEWLVHKLNGTPQTQEWRKRSPTLLTREYKPWADNVPVWATLRAYRWVDDVVCQERVCVGGCLIYRRSLVGTSQLRGAGHFPALTSSHFLSHLPMLLSVVPSCGTLIKASSREADVSSQQVSCYIFSLGFCVLTFDYIQLPTQSSPYTKF